MQLLDLFFLFGAVGPLPSIVLYVIFPNETVEYFNGEPSPTASFWCSVNGSADATISFLCFCALCTKSAEIKILVVRTFAVYAVFHWGACWFWTNHGDAHPEWLANGYPVSIAISLAAAFWWGWYRPPVDVSRNGYETFDASEQRE